MTGVRWERLREGPSEVWEGCLRWLGAHGTGVLKRVHVLTFPSTPIMLTQMRTALWSSPQLRSLRDMHSSATLQDAGIVHWQVGMNDRGEVGAGMGGVWEGCSVVR